jgi:hypothetical protein
MIMHSQDVDWVSIAEQVSVEMDSAKLAILVKRLCHALDARGGPAEDETKRESEQIVASLEQRNPSLRLRSPCEEVGLQANLRRRNSHQSICR